ncbi:hypothetical protein [Tenacibaculum haliotis]|uniref:hypothetical protein n=1 Tax=Tenacibaculum haliotis TaxID=1888914 RepID=UPI0021B08C11|nr:hypothetical protein [Tenacibaculum haliotis]MCT4699934.1 hypothetical protein [Tenacibaculum haliotis]
MKINISIMTWINRVLMIPFLVLLILSILENDFLSLAAILAFVIGVFQVFSFLLTLFYSGSINKFERKLMLIYGIAVVLYFGACFFVSEYNFNKNDIIYYILCAIPVVLSIHWTSILEMIKKEI